MSSAPLKPFSLPANLPASFGGAFTFYTFTTWFFYFALGYWVIYTLVAVYHWVTYAHSPSVAVPAIALHLFVSLVLLGYAVSGIV